MFAQGSSQGMDQTVYTFDYAKELLKVSEDDMKELVSDGAVRAFRLVVDNHPQLVFNAEDIDTLGAIPDSALNE